jgi:hypothetical protein
MPPVADALANYPNAHVKRSEHIALELRRRAGELGLCHLGQLPQITHERRTLGVGSRPGAGLLEHLLQLLDTTVDLGECVGDSLGSGMSTGRPDYRA